MRKVAIIVLMIALAGCSHAQKGRPPADVLLYTVPSGLTKTESGYKIPNPPDWTYKELKENEFRGVSRNAAMENEAQESALDAAAENIVRQLAQFTSRNGLQIISEVGLSNNIWNPEIVAMNIKKQVYEATIKNVKDMEWYTEVWDNNVSGRYYKKYVKVRLSGEAITSVVKAGLDAAREDLARKRRETSEKEAVRKIDRAIELIGKVNPQFFNISE